MGRIINSGIPFAIYFENKIKRCKISPNRVNETCESWITVSNGWHIVLDRISPIYSLTDALSMYYSDINNSSWFSPRQYFLKLICSSCSHVTVYMEPTDIPFCGGKSGQLVCPHCQQEWLTYQYEE
ncbi:MAG: hypothetical protein WC516_07060 [Patescibacteria group bacterium]|jgi:hypothetical protein